MRKRPEKALTKPTTPRRLPFAPIGPHEDLPASDFFRLTERHTGTDKTPEQPTLFPSDGAA